MSTIHIFYDAVIPNIKYIIPVLVYFFLSFVVGFVFFRAFLKEREWFLVIPVSMLLGIFINILFLAVFSYFFKGPVGVLIINIIFGLSAILLLLKNKNILDIVWPRFIFKDIIVLCIWLIFLVFMTLIAGNNTYGGDVIAYWGFATSFANGNYPLMSPWQPNLLANHHQGGYLYEGAIFALAQVNISLIHTLFSIMVITAGFLLIWGYVRHLSKYVFISIIPAVVFFIAFSTIFIPLPEFFKQFLPYEVIHEINKWPIFTDAKNRLGGSSNLNEIVYINHRVTAFAGMLLILVLISLEWIYSKKWQMIALVLLLVPIFSTDEVVLPGISFGILAWWIQNMYVDQKKKLLLFWSVASVFLLIAVFFIVGSALRDSILTPTAVPRFQLVTSFLSLKARFNEMNGAILSFPAGFILYLPSLLWYFLLALIISIRLRKSFIWFLLFSAIGTTIAFFFAEHTFYPGNQGRFLHLIYLILGLLISFGGVILLRAAKKTNVLLGILIISLFVPAIFTSSVYLAKVAKATTYPNFNGSMPDYAVLKWIQHTVPHERVLFVDGYLYDQPYSYLSLVGIQNYGLIVPVSPTNYKVHTPDFGPEMVDALYTLNPNSLSDLQIKYVFISRKHLQYFPLQRLNDIHNENFFEMKYGDLLGELYEVKTAYYSNGTIIQPSLNSMVELIKLGSRVYIDYPNNIDINLRSVLMLALKDKADLYTNWGPGAFNYIETIIPYKSPTKDKIYDYLLLMEQTNPKSVSDQNVLLIWQLGKLRLYQTK